MLDGLNKSLPQDPDHSMIRLNHLSFLEPLSYGHSVMKLCVEVITLIGYQIKSLTVFLEYFELSPCPQEWLLSYNFVWIWFQLLDESIVAIINEFLEPFHFLEVIFREYLILLVV